MFYRLGEFHPKLGSSDFETLLDHRITAELMLRVLEEMLQVRLSRSPSGGDGPSRIRLGTLPDLRHVLPPEHPDAEWVGEVHRGLASLYASIGIRLLACEYDPGPDGFLTIAATSSSVTGEVQPGDRVQAGFVAFRDRDQPVRISSRPFRLVCYNGSIVSVHGSEDLAAGTVEDRVARCFDRVSFDGVLEALRASTRAPVSLPALRDEFQRLMEQYPEEVQRWREELRSKHLQDLVDRHVRVTELNELRMRAQEARAEGTMTWAVINAVTAIARDLPDPRLRHALEELAGRLALPRKPVPRRRASLARELQQV